MMDQDRHDEHDDPAVTRLDDRSWRVEHPGIDARVRIDRSGFSGNFLLLCRAPGYEPGAIVLPAEAGEGIAIDLARMFVSHWRRAELLRAAPIVARD